MPRVKFEFKTVYKFEELPEEAKEKAIEKQWDINVDYEWWQWAYEDAKEIGLKITGFDIGRGNYCEGEFIEYPENVAENIIKNHGEQCETYKTAKEYLEGREKFIEQEREKWDSEEEKEGRGMFSDCEFDSEDLDYDDLNGDFKKELLEDYMVILTREYDYQTSEEAIIETIEANDYDFDIEGNIV